MQKTLLMATLLLLAAGCSEKNEEPAKAAQSTETAKTTVVAEAAAEKEFMNKCIQQARGPVSSADMEKICLCSLDGIKERYPMAQLNAMMDNASESEKMEFMKFSLNIGMDCAVKVRAGQL